jgi:hypothetical protein
MGEDGAIALTKVMKTVKTIHSIRIYMMNVADPIIMDL